MARRVLAFICSVLLMSGALVGNASPAAASHAPGWTNWFDGTSKSSERRSAPVRDGIVGVAAESDCSFCYVFVRATRADGSFVQARGTSVTAEYIGQNPAVVLIIPPGTVSVSCWHSAPYERTRLTCEYLRSTTRAPAPATGISAWGQLMPVTFVNDQSVPSREWRSAPAVAQRVRSIYVQSAFSLDIVSARLDVAAVGSFQARSFEDVLLTFSKVPDGLPRCRGEATNGATNVVLVCRYSYRLW